LALLGNEDKEIIKFNLSTRRNFFQLLQKKLLIFSLQFSTFFVQFLSKKICYSCFYRRQDSDTKFSKNEMSCSATYQSFFI